LEAENKGRNQLTMFTWKMAIKWYMYMYMCVCCAQCVTFDNEVNSF